MRAVFKSKDPESQNKMKIDHFAHCMKEIKLKLTKQEMSDLQKALLDIDADFITYSKFLVCVLIGMLCKDLDALRAHLASE